MNQIEGAHGLIVSEGLKLSHVFAAEYPWASAPSMIQLTASSSAIGSGTGMVVRYMWRDSELSDRGEGRLQCSPSHTSETEAFKGTLSSLGPPSPIKVNKLPKGVHGSNQKLVFFPF